MLVEARIISAPVEPNAFEPQYSVADKIPEVAKTHPLGPLFSTYPVWEIPSVIQLGGKDIKIDILHREAFTESPYHVTIASFLKGYKGLGLPIRGWTGAESAILADVYESPNTSGGISVHLEKSSLDTEKRLAKLGFQVVRLPSDAREIQQWYTSGNPNLPHLYPGGTRNDYLAVHQAAMAPSVKRGLKKAA